MSSPVSQRVDKPENTYVTPLLTDLYQVTMAYAYWKAGRHMNHSVFDLFFRKNPFHGEYTLFCGLEDVVRHVANFRFSEAEVEHIRSIMPHAEEGYFDYLRGLDASEIRISAVPEGSPVFPRVPVLIVEGPLGVCQLLETTLLTLCNYASLMATNASRFRSAAGPGKTLLEFGLRRAQGADGGMSASRFAYVGGFDGTSNVLASKLYGVPCRGTHAHSFVTSYTSLDEVPPVLIDGVDLKAAALKHRREQGWEGQTNDSELAAFLAYTAAFPDGLVALVDTYDTLRSGVPNFLCVALALHDAGRTALGIRLDSGDLAYLSKRARAQFREVAARTGVEALAGMTIVASNDINEAVLHSLAEQGHEIDAFGIGTNLVTCQSQPALGMVYKLVEVDGTARIKLSQDIKKVTLPGAKKAFRLFGAEGPLVDLMLRPDEADPQPGVRIMCRHPFAEKKRVYVTPRSVERLHKLVFDGAQGGVMMHMPTLEARREVALRSLAAMREDHRRTVNPTPFKVSVSDTLYDFVHEMWLQEVPIPELA